MWSDSDRVRAPGVALRLAGRKHGKRAQKPQAKRPKKTRQRENANGRAVGGTGGSAVVKGFRRSLWVWSLGRVLLWVAQGVAVAQGVPARMGRR